jgi:hypothetical protein
MLRASTLLTILNEHMPFSPHVGPLGDGGVQISWERGGRALEFFINADGSVDYLTEHPGGGTSEHAFQASGLRMKEELGDLVRAFLGT